MEGLIRTFADLASDSNFLAILSDELPPIPQQTLELAAADFPAITSHFQWKTLLRILHISHENAAADDLAYSSK